MHSNEPVPPPEGIGGGRRGSARRWLVPACALGVLAVLVPVLWVTGGLKEKPTQPVKTAGTALNLGLFTVTVRDARIGLVKEGFGDAQERFLIVRMSVENKGKETEPLGIGGLGDGVVALTRTGKWVQPERVEGVAGGADTDVVQPGLPVEASAMWKMGPADSPEKLTVGLRAWKYEHGFTDEDFNWIVQREGGALVGRLTLAVAPMSVAPRPPQGTPPSPRATVSGS
ncbi:hypothetical protein [Actinomadura livida]|uniref:DUF4352 domain-containing protein n=1 Tax=Actinomadura livida TaxID=79909 RepID=A0A7W7I950_9ACTN|nr:MULTISPECIES: hypothetical protein [Actinomadura]MBB4772794.1 hypothetical protein [Actinomadura catellatispora]